MAETVKINLVTVGADQAAKQTKTLREQIKDLRNELAGLTEGTDEYNAKVKELGDLMHQQSEITNQARMATEDYGQTLSNLTRISAGVVGAFTAIQGAMNLLGTENEDAQEAIKTMTSLMGIIQGLTALDQAGKAFKGLATRVKLATTETREHTQSLQQNSTAAKTDAANLTTAATATKAQGTAAGTATKMTNGLSLGFKKLGLSIKSFMMSNPFTLILLGATALISVITTLINKTKEEAKELKKMQLEAQQATIDANNTYINAQTSTNLTSEEKMSVGRKKLDKIQTNEVINPSDTDKLLKYEEQIEKLKVKLLELKDADQEFSDEYVNTYQELINRQQALFAGKVKWYKDMIDSYGVLIKYATDEEKIKEYEEAIKGFEQELNNIYSSFFEFDRNVTEYINSKRKKNAADEKKQEDDNKNAWEKQKQKDLQKLKDKLSLELLYNERAYKANEISLQEYNDKSKDIREQHLVDYDRWAKKYRVKEEDTKLYREQTNDQIIANERATLEEMLRIRELENDPTNAINTRNAQQAVEQAKQAAEARKASEDAILAQSVEYAEKANELYNASMLRKMILIDKWGKAELDAQHQIEMELLNDQMEAQRGQEQQLEQTYQQQIADQEAITQAKSDALDEQYTNGLMSEQAYLEAIEQLWNEHYQKLDEMEAEHITSTAEIQEEQANTMLEIQQKEFDYEKAKWEERKTLVQNYYSAFTQIVGGIQGLLTELQGAYKEDSKEYENIAEANIIISGITGALEAFQSAMSLGFPYNLIVGGIMSGISIATTTAALNNLKSKKLSSSAQKASINYSPYETISTETGANIEGSIGDTRVTVLESDIAETTDRVNVAEFEATF